MKKKRKFFVILFTIIFIIVLFYFIVTKPLINRYCEEETISLIHDLINESNEYLISKKLIYNDFFSVKTDENGDLTDISANTGLINQISLIWGTDIQNRIERHRTLKLNFPFGKLTGSAVLSEYGSKVHLTVQFVSNCAMSYHSQFEEKGINHVLHTLYLKATVTITFLTPQSLGKTSVCENLLLTESLIQGKIPTTFINGTDGLQYLDLLE